MPEPFQKDEKQPVNFLEIPEVKIFLADREIKEEDYQLIERILRTPERDRRQIAIENHNTFSLMHERSLPQIERDLSTEKTRLEQIPEEKIASTKLTYLEVQSEILKKYDWTVAWGLNVLLERLRL